MVPTTTAKCSEEKSVSVSCCVIVVNIPCKIKGRGFYHNGVVNIDTLQIQFLVFVVELLCLFAAYLCKSPRFS